MRTPKIYWSESVLRWLEFQFIMLASVGRTNRPCSSASQGGSNASAKLCSQLCLLTMKRKQFNSSLHSYFIQLWTKRIWTSFLYYLETSHFLYFICSSFLFSILGALILFHFYIAFQFIKHLIFPDNLNFL